jgi:hypothetical protein
MISWRSRSLPNYPSSLAVQPFDDAPTLFLEVFFWSAIASVIGLIASVLVFSVSSDSSVVSYFAGSGLFLTILSVGSVALSILSWVVG